MHRTNDIRRARQVFATDLVEELRLGGEADHRQRTESGEDAHGKGRQLHACKRLHTYRL